MPRVWTKGPAVTDNGKASVVIAEEHTLIREALTALCERAGRYAVLAGCEDGEQALNFVSRLRPDFAILDLQLPRLYTLEVVSQLRRLRIPSRVVVLSLRRDRKTVLETLRAGASAYLLKSDPATHLLQAFEQVLGGGVYISPELRPDEIFSGQKAPNGDDPLRRLSAREFQVFSLLVEGVRAKEIAARLVLSPKTVDTYRASLMRKLDIYDVAGLVKFAVARNLTSAPW